MFYHLQHINYGDKHGCCVQKQRNYQHIYVTPVFECNCQHLTTSNNYLWNTLVYKGQEQRLGSLKTGNPTRRMQWLDWYIETCYTWHMKTHSWHLLAMSICYPPIETVNLTNPSRTQAGWIIKTPDIVKIQLVIPALRWHCTHAAKDHANPNEPMLLRAWNRRKIAKHDPVEASVRHPRLSQGGWPCASLRPLNGRQMELERPTETGHRQTWQTRVMPTATNNRLR